VEAALQPEVFRRFYELLDGKRLPEDVYAGNMIQQELEIKSSLTDECLRIVKANGVFVGVLGEVGGALYVSLSTEHALDEKLQRPASPRRKSRPKARAEEPARETPTPTQPPSPAAEAIGGTVFIGHAGSPDVAAFLKSALESFDIACGVAESDQADDRPISQGVSEQMRACDVAVLVFARPESGDKGEVSSQKMMCQLGAAWVLFEERVVALAESDLLHWGEQTGGLRVLEFHREKLGELGLALLAELRRIGVIDVRTAAA
jgi:hypothetical protein